MNTIYEDYELLIIKNIIIDYSEIIVITYNN